MKNKQKTQPTKKRIFTYYLILAACLLVIAAITVGVVFAVKPVNSDNPTIDSGTTDDTNPPVKDPDDEEPTVDTSSKYELIAPVKSVVVSQAHVFWHNQTLDIYHLHEGMDLQSSMLQSLATIPPGIMRTLKANAKLRFFSDISKPIS